MEVVFFVHIYLKKEGVYYASLLDKVVRLGHSENAWTHFAHIYGISRISIIGLPDDVKLAEILIHQILANQPSTESFVMHIPSTFIGPIIGRNGESIRSLQDRSGCHIDIER